MEGTVKLAQALIERKVLKNKIHDLVELIDEVATIQEGDEVPDIAKMLSELDELHDEHYKLDLAIRDANYAYSIFPHKGTVMLLQDAIAVRDLWKYQSKSYGDLAGLGAGAYRGLRGRFRRSQSEIRYIDFLDRNKMMELRDDYAQRARDIDAAIQARNWEIEL
jgi:hypothetical protein